jgi:eukaryotic-like serine/threonine-protein kinase
VDFVKVLDFGLVKRDVSSQETQLSVEGVVTGTPAFIAPEVAMGSKVVDHRVDIYMFGAVAFYLLCGEPVFDEANGVLLAMAHIQKEPRPPSELSPFSVTADLDALILDCLAKSPEDRPQTIAEVRQRLSAIEPAESWGDSEAKKWWWQHLPATRAQSATGNTGGETYQLTVG